MRKEVPNTFTEGIIADLNPINTPSNALTDCLNGTLITYDDNEWSLQNDKGNYPLKNCRLKAGYVPVGLQEYNGVLYIISHNPEENKTEIGSYPSPGTVIEEESKENGVELDIHYGPWPDSQGIYSYEEFCNNNNSLYTFIGSGGQQAWLINPGDQIRVDQPTAASPLYYQYFLLNKEHTSIDVTNEVSDIAGKGFNYVPWKSSGWLAVKPTLPNISDFRVNIRKLKLVPYVNTFTYDFNVQIEFEGNFGSALGLNAVRVDHKTSDSSELLTVAGTSSLPLPNGRTVKFYNFTGSLSDFDYACDFIFTPYITYNSHNYSYVSYSKTIKVDPNNTAKLSDIEIASRVFTYNVNSRADANNDGSITVTFSSGNIEEVALLSEDVELYYTISRFDNSNEEWVPIELESGKHYKKYNDFAIYGTNSIELATSVYSENNYDDDDKLFAEDIYRFQFVLTTPLDASGLSTLEAEASDEDGVDDSREATTIYSIVTELMNGNTSVRYDQVSASEWIEKYPKTIKDKNNSLTFDIGSATPTIDYITGDSAFNFWKSGSTLIYNTAFPREIYDTELKDGFKIMIGASVEGTPVVTTGLSILTGPIWDTICDNTKVLIDTGVYYFDKYSGHLENLTFSSRALNFESVLSSRFITYNTASLVDYIKHELNAYESGKCVLNLSWKPDVQNKDKPSRYTRASVQVAGEGGTNIKATMPWYATNSDLWTITVPIKKMFDSIDRPLLFVDFVLKPFTNNDNTGDISSKSFSLGYDYDFVTGSTNVIKPGATAYATQTHANKNSATDKHVYFIARNIPEDAQSGIIFYRIVPTASKSAYDIYLEMLSELEILETTSDEPSICKFVQASTDGFHQLESIPLSLSFSREISFGEISNALELLPQCDDIIYGSDPIRFLNITLSTIISNNIIIQPGSSWEDFVDEIEDINDSVVQQYEDFTHDPVYNLTTKDVNDRLMISDPGNTNIVTQALVDALNNEDGSTYKKLSTCASWYINSVTPGTIGNFGNLIVI